MTNDESAHFRALLIGNWEYVDPEKMLQPLRGPRHDIQVLRDALTHEEFGLFDPADVEVHENLTSDVMSSTLYRFVSQAQREDRLLIYYSGHGEKINSKEELGLCGTTVEYSLRASQCVPSSRLREWIEEANRAPSTIVILDCCYAGRFRGGGADTLEITEQAVVESFGRGTAVLTCGGNEPAIDTRRDDEPSPFTMALSRILTDPTVTGGRRGLVSTDDVYDALLRWRDPMLQPRPRRNVDGQGAIALAKRPAAAPTCGELQPLAGWRTTQQIDVVTLTFDGERVVAKAQDVPIDDLPLTAFDASRQAAVRRLVQLADAVVRTPDYVTEPIWQQAVHRAWECVGSNLFDHAVPADVRRRICGDLDPRGQRILKLRLAFEGGAAGLEAYPWEYLQIGPADEAQPPVGEVRRPLALRDGFLLERVVPVRDGHGTPALPPTANPSVAVINSLPAPWSIAGERAASQFDEMSNLTLPVHLEPHKASWTAVVNALDNRPRYLVLCAPIRRRDHVAEVGFARTSGELEWHVAGDLADEFEKADLNFDAVIVVTFAAGRGLDTFRGTFQLAREWAGRGFGPIVFVCHAQGYERHLASDSPVFPVLLLDALSRQQDFDRSVYYARDRVIRLGDADTRRTFGVPGYYAPRERPAVGNIDGRRRTIGAAPTTGALTGFDTGKVIA